MRTPEEIEKIKEQRVNLWTRAAAGASQKSSAGSLDVVRHADHILEEFDKRFNKHNSHPETTRVYDIHDLIRPSPDHNVHLTDLHFLIRKYNIENLTPDTDFKEVLKMLLVNPKFGERPTSDDPMSVSTAEHLLGYKLIRTD